MHRKTTVRLSCLAIVLAASLPWLAQATVYTWDGNGDSNSGGNWSTPANWNPDGTPGAGDTAVLPSVTSGTRTVTVDVATTVGTLTATATHTNGNSRNIVFLAADLSISNAVGYNVEMVSASGTRLTLRNGSTYVIFKYSGAGGLTKTGAGALQNHDPNFSTGGGMPQHTGTTIISEGVLYDYGYSVGEYLGGASVTVSNGAQIELDGWGGGVRAAIELHGFGANGRGAYYAHANEMVLSGGTVTLATTAGIWVEKRSTQFILDVTNRVTGPGGLVKLGPHTLRLSAVCDYAGGTIVSQGTLEVYGSITGNVTVASGATLVAAQEQIIGGTVTVQPGGTWSQLVQWSGNGDANNSGMWSDTNNWQPRILPNTNHTVLLPGVTGNGNDGVPARSITVTGTVSIAKLDASQANSGASFSLLVLSNDFTVGQLVSGTMLVVSNQVPGAWFTVGNSSRSDMCSSGGPGGFRKAGSGTLYMGDGAPGTPPDLNHTGPTAIDEGRLYIYGWGSARYINNSSMVTVSNGAQIELDGWGGGVKTPITLNGTGIGANGAMYAHANTMVMPGPVTLATDSSVWVQWRATDNAITVSKPVSGPGRLTKVGPAGLILTATNTYTGGTTVSAGTNLLSGVLANCKITVAAGATFMAGPSTGTLNFNVGSAASDIVTNRGTFAISNLAFVVNASAGEPGHEVCAVDYSGGGTIVGSAFASVTLPRRWQITYSGTPTYPSAIVLIPPARGTLIFIR